MTDLPQDSANSAATTEPKSAIAIGLQNSPGISIQISCHRPGLVGRHRPAKFVLHFRRSRILVPGRNLRATVVGLDLAVPDIDALLPIGIAALPAATSITRSPARMSTASQRRSPTICSVAYDSIVAASPSHSPTLLDRRVSGGNNSGGHTNSLSNF